MSKSTSLKILNFVWFQTIWWLVILFRNDAVLPVIGLIILWLVFSPKRVQDIKLMSMVLIIGTVTDALLTVFGIFIFDETNTLVALWPIPIWLSLLWAAFAGTVYHSLTMFKGRTLLAALGGAVFAPLSYIAGAKFGAVELGVSLMWSYIIIAMVWSVIFPLCFYLSMNVDRDTVKA
jgi:hypothetical protein